MFLRRNPIWLARRASFARARTRTLRPRSERWHSPTCAAVATSLLLSACELQVTGAAPPDDGRREAELDAAASEVSHATERDGQEPSAPLTDAADPDGQDGAQDTSSRDGATDADDAATDAAHVFDGAGGAGDAGADAAAASDAGANPDASSECSVSGSFATELLFDVGWNQTTLGGIVPLLAAGTGQIRMVVRLDLGGSPASASARLTACGTTLPDFKASNALIGTEYYAAYVPESAWEHSEMPHPAFGLSFGCTTPGCALTTDHVVATFGARAFPNDLWPGRTGAIDSLVPLDHDGDRQPAIKFVSRGKNEKNALGMAYIHIPVTWTLNARATEADIAFRITGVFTGKVEHCDLFSGVVSSGSVEARAVGCRALRDGSSTPFNCSSEQSTFLDQNLPAWQVRGGTFRARRVSAEADCTTVRSALR
jgi:hypothetical protein